jgi:GNAT superfamily N-acetyltransferase
VIRPCDQADFEEIWTIINDGAKAYRGVIPSDQWHEPYMTREELQNELLNGVAFWGYEQDGSLQGVMGIQDVLDVTLIRHAYVRTSKRRYGIGGMLLTHLKTLTRRSILIGTWSNASWAVRFYEKHGFRTVNPEAKDLLLRKYWSVTARQIETSIVLCQQ